MKINYGKNTEWKPLRHDFQFSKGFKTLTTETNESTNEKKKARNESTNETPKETITY